MSHTNRTDDIIARANVQCALAMAESVDRGIVDISRALAKAWGAVLGVVKGKRLSGPLAGA